MIIYIKRKLKVLTFRILKPIVDEIFYTTHVVYGYKARLKIHPNAMVVNSLFNTFSGKITIEEYAFTGHNVSFLAGSHDYHKKNKVRMLEIPPNGHDIYVETGAWIGSNCTIIGPCRIGKNAVIAAGSVVVNDIMPGTIVGGVPCKLIKRINFD
jgi:acetyltransferase-like isoleucine patch superfamily enzyme